MEIKLINEQAFMIYEEQIIKPEIKKKLLNVVDIIEKGNHPAIKSVNSSYTSVIVEFDGLNYDYQEIINDLNLNNLEYFDNEYEKPKKTIFIPVLYGLEYGPDLEIVAKHNQLTTKEVVNIHTKSKYLIYAIGFLPGFPFLGGLDERIHTPRKDTPRSKIPAGSVGIANNQTGLYPKTSPGGWQLIGRTPINVFDLKREPSILYETGDYIQFYEITIEEYESIKKEVLNNSYDYEQLVGEIK